MILYRMVFYYFRVHCSTAYSCEKLQPSGIKFFKRARFTRWNVVAGSVLCWDNKLQTIRTRKRPKVYGRITYRFLNNTFHTIYFMYHIRCSNHDPTFSYFARKNDYPAHCSNGVVLCTSVSSLRSHNNNNNNMISYLANSDYLSVYMYRLHCTTLENVINSIL